ncbi:hypothetical protein DUNSADRAFT_11406 [Dunaliella salina]|uniref:DUF1995 domain-containing protein n=1 Tax=Dunaliella salina TaxID=3046 RepID=A0ABQ7GDH3_DUNSA|nr:hypothetical protein DUNSADRAFT_11406 [Dunaliella salina]|eukprot:KAF5832662.1 hypothetical protein DUNSADRAFT_11406 [Dunaliella salina]
MSLSSSALQNKGTPQHHGCTLVLRSSSSNRDRLRCHASVNDVRQPPPRTCTQAVLQAKGAMRAFREAKAAGFQGGGTPQPHPRYWLTVELPVPVKRSLVNPFAASAGSEAEDLILANDESDWPGGMQQRFRALRPQVDLLIEGYPNSKFLGLLEADEDGVGLWTCGADMTLCGQVTNPTFPTLVKLLDGGYGSRVLAPGHTIIAINPSWGSSREIGQIWERSLKKRAAEIMGEIPKDGSSFGRSQETTGAGAPGTSSSSSQPERPRQWDPLYHCRIVRTSRGGTGLLHRAWPGPWRVYEAPAGNASKIGELVLKSDVRPSAQQLVDVLSEAKREARKWF